MNFIRNVRSALAITLSSVLPSGYENFALRSVDALLLAAAVGAGWWLYKRLKK